MAVARAIVGSPRVVLADEPTGNLDPGTAGEVQALLLELQREHRCAMIVATHSRALAAGHGPDPQAREWHADRGGRVTLARVARVIRFGPAPRGDGSGVRRSRARGRGLGRRQQTGRDRCDSRQRHARTRSSARRNGRRSRREGDLRHGFLRRRLGDVRRAARRDPSSSTTSPSVPTSSASSSRG